MPKRIKSFFKGLVCLVLTGFLVLIIYKLIEDEYKLHYYGRQAIGTVIDYKYERHRSRRRYRTYHYHTLVYDGHHKRFDLGRHFENGTRFYVLYIPSSPDIATIAKAQESFFQLVKDDLGWWGLLFLPLIVFVLGFSTVSHFVAVIRPENESPD